MSVSGVRRVVDRALEWLEAAYTGRSSLMWSLDVDPIELF